MVQEESISGQKIIPENTLIGNKYLVGERIAETGLSIIYRGTNKETKEPIIIKTLNEYALEDARNNNDQKLESIISRAFFNEGIILSQIGHPGIPRLYGHYLTAFTNKATINARVLEYVPSHLDEFFTNKPFIHAVSDFIRQSASILEYLEENGIIHGDIKPQNIMCNSGSIKIIDFNSASHASQKGSKRKVRLQDGYILMTDAYAPPELKMGCMPSSDIYSLGKTLEKIIIAQNIKDFSILRDSSGTTLAKEPSAKYDKSKINIFELLLSLPMALVDIHAKCINPDPSKRIKPAELKSMADRLEEKSNSSLYAGL